MTDSTRSKALEVIYEIIRQSPGDEIIGKTRLFKAFYFAHLYYAHREAGFLTEWRIVRMPRGPGIDCFKSLISELQQKGFVTVEPTRVGPFAAVKYRAADTAPDRNLLPQAIQAIREAVEFIADKTATELSAITHEFSRSWNEARNDGEELNIYVDLIDDEEHAQNQEMLEKTRQELDDAWV